MKTLSRNRNGSSKKSDGVVFRMAASTTTSTPGGGGAPSGSAPAPPTPTTRPRVLLPGKNRPLSVFAHEVGEILRNAIGDRIVPTTPAERSSRRLTYEGNPANESECFLCFRFGVFGRIKKSAKTGKFASSVFFEPINHQQAVTELERWIEFGFEASGRIFVGLSMTPAISKTLLSSAILSSYLPKVDRVLEFSIPIKLLTKYEIPFDPFNLDSEEEEKRLKRWKAHNERVDQEICELETDPFRAKPEGGGNEGEESASGAVQQFYSAPLYKTLFVSEAPENSDGDCHRACMITGANGTGESSPMVEPENPPASPPPAGETDKSKSDTSKPNPIEGKIASWHLLKLEPGFGQYVEANGEWVFYYCDRYLGFEINSKEAEVVLNEVFREFELQSQDKTNAIARLLTPHCQGLMGWRKRSPLWVMTANKPRSGKDCMAMIAPIVHSQLATQDPPLEYEEEVKRRITTALMAGRRFMHFANCRSDLDNPSLEAAVTTEYWTDRAIGTSYEETVPNEIMFSLSYNGSLPLTPDLARRMCVIRVFNSREDKDANEKKYDNNLHAMLSAFEPPVDEANPRTYLCRRNVLAALDALIVKWAKEGGKPGCHNTSFPEWAHYVGGILVANDLGDPTRPDTAIQSMTTSTDWEDAFLQLAKDVCAKGGGKYYSSKQLYEKFIMPNQMAPAYSAYNDYLINTDHKNPETAFNSALTKSLNSKLPFATISGTDKYFVERYPKPTVPQYRFRTEKIASEDSSSKATATPPAEEKKNVPVENSNPVPASATGVGPDVSQPVTPEQAKPASTDEKIPVPFPD